MKTDTLSGPELNFAVAMADGLSPMMSHAYYLKVVEEYGDDHWFATNLKTEPNIPVIVNVIGDMTAIPDFSNEWGHGGPIIEKGKINFVEISSNNEWVATMPRPKMVGWRIMSSGPTQLIAAMRCFVKSELGEDVDLPEELI